MPSWGGLLICSTLALGFYFAFGLALTLRIAPARTAILTAPLIGWAVHSAAALPILSLTGMTRVSIAFVFVVTLLGSLATLAGNARTILAGRPAPVLLAALAFAVVLSLFVAMGAWPKVQGDSVTFAGPIFDHSKVAIVDEMSRLGLPPGNPFLGSKEAGASLSYYYLWHFSAAQFSLLLGVGGWTADVALAWFTGFASLSAMMGVVLVLGGRVSAALWVVALAATASVRPLITAVIDPMTAQDFFGEASGLGGWLFQASWAPQHAASAATAMLALLLIARLCETPRVLTAIVLALTLAAAFESSTWIGGIVLPLSASIVALVVIAQAGPGARWRTIVYLGAAGVMAVVLVSPFIIGQLAAAAARGHGVPIAIEPYTVLFEPAGIARDVANLAAYWLLFLPVEFPAFFVTGVIAAFWLSKQPASGTLLRLALTVLMVVGLMTAWLLRSTLAENNDLGWRAILPAVMVLIVFAAVWLSHRQERPRTLSFAAAAGLVLLGVPESVTLIRHNLMGEPGHASAGFAKSAALWEAVRQHTAPDQRIANNPNWFSHMTPWPANISWALLANRRSCYAGTTFTVPFVGLSAERDGAIAAQFTRVFDGTASAQDVEQLATQYDCSLILLTPEDGAWSGDPFAASPHYRAVENNATRRLYERVKRD